MALSRRHFIFTSAAATLVAGTGLTSLVAHANSGYELINPPQNTANPEKIEVLEFFWLGCPHCYSFEPSIEDWKKRMPEDVVFVREAPPLNRSWEQHSRGFYAAQLMGYEDPFVVAMFTAIHENRQRMRRPDDIAELASGLGMDKDKFLKTMESFAVQTKMNRAMQLARGAGITGVPAITINGKYRTGAGLAGGNAGVIRVIDETIALERQSGN